MQPNAGTGGIPEAGTLRFVPRAALARRENLSTLLALLVLMPAALFLLRGVREPATLTGAGLAVALAGYLFYEIRFRRYGLRALLISEEGLAIRLRDRVTKMSWRDIDEAVHTYRLGERWTLQSRVTRRRHVLLLDGFRHAEIDRINRLIAERVNR